MVVPCGKCSACFNHKSYQMVQRLEIEASLHKYVVFFTLTFDNQHLPKLCVLGDCLYDPDQSHCAPDRPRISFNIDSTNPSVRDRKFLRKMEKIGVPYLNRYMAQKFMKRLRINNYRLHLNSDQDVEKSLLRFYLCGEYGPKNYRPHFHGILFFDSELTSKNIESLIRQSWKFGFVDCSFVKNTCSSYVAQYVNCTSHLPSIYKHCEIRPFCLYSTCPPIGAQYFNDERIQEIFRECSPSVSVADRRRRNFLDVPLWRYFEDRLFPRCPLFDKISHFDRIALYRVATFAPFCSAEEFVFWSSDPAGKSESLFRLLKNISNNFTLESSLYRLYAISHIVWSNSIWFDVDISTYVDHIERYYQNLKMFKFKKQIAYEDDYVKNGGKVSDLVWFDSLWIESLMITDDSDMSIFQVSDSVRLQLESFGIDVSLFFDVDLTKRQEYYDFLSLSLTKDYQEFMINSDKIQKDSTKTKKKNDYLSNDGQCISDIYNSL